MPPILSIFSDARLLIGLGLIIVLVVGTNLVLVNVLRGKRPDQREGSAWGRALGGARRAQRQQTADYAKLHEIVTALAAKADEGEKPNE